MTKYSVEYLRKASMAVFLACEEGPATDISNLMRWAADEIERLRLNVVSHPDRAGGES